MAASFPAAASMGFHNMHALRLFLREDRGSDLVEYTLLLAFVCLAGAAAFIGMGQTIGGLWNATNTRLSSAANP